jgi:hypothetical protein
LTTIFGSSSSGFFSTFFGATLTIFVSATALFRKTVFFTAVASISDSTLI